MSSTTTQILKKIQRYTTVAIVVTAVIITFILLSSFYDQIDNVPQTIGYIILFIFVIVVFFIIGLKYVIKPITHHILIEQQELEDRVKEGQVKLSKVNEKLKYLVVHDYLTSALNRRGFYDVIRKEIARSKRYQLSFSLVFIDLNHFKKINDTLGHLVGDQFLVHIAEKLKTTIRKEDSMGRLGGDEFGILLINLNEESKDLLEKRIKNVAQESVQIGELTLNNSASMGVASYPHDGITVEELMRFADAEMYKNKQMTRDQPN